DLLWKTQTLHEWLDNGQLKKLLWCPAEGELSFTCIDAADAIGSVLKEYGGVVCASATFGPEAEFAGACGLADVNPTAPTRSYSVVRAATPWRDSAYDVAVDARVDTSYQQRSRFSGTTAATI